MIRRYDQFVKLINYIVSIGIDYQIAHVQWPISTMHGWKGFDWCAGYLVLHARTNQLKPELIKAKRHPGIESKSNGIAVPLRTAIPSKENTRPTIRPKHYIALYCTVTTCVVSKP